MENENANEANNASAKASANANLKENANKAIKNCEELQVKAQQILEDLRESRTIAREAVQKYEKAVMEEKNIKEREISELNKQINEHKHRQSLIT